MGRIVVVNDYLAQGGAERVMAELMNDWDSRGEKVTFLSCLGDLCPDEYHLNDSIERIDINARTKNKKIRYLLAVIRLVRLLRREKDAVAVALLLPAMRVVSVASLFVRNRMVYSERNDPSRYPEEQNLRRERDWHLGHADMCVFQTEEARDYFPESVQKKGVVIPNPINPELPDRTDGERCRVIIAACRLEDQKNIPMMIDAFSSFHEQYPDYTLEIYGRGPKEEELRTYISSKGMEDSVFLKGFSTDIYALMNSSAMYVSSSDYEGISNSMLEALALGMPCVCTDCPVGGARLAIQDGESGLLVPVGDSEAMSAAMKRIAGDPALAKKLADNAYKLRERFSVEEISRQWLEAIRSL